ncbi:MAG: hypothetical protein D6743_03290 [Calditrichaeota bacterium]|nr:MAG: hypothetical protein D6743_03290 [Calditrichota bacterium]
MDEYRITPATPDTTIIGRIGQKPPRRPPPDKREQKKKKRSPHEVEERVEISHVQPDRAGDTRGREREDDRSPDHGKGERIDITV